MFFQASHEFWSKIVTQKDSTHYAALPCHVLKAISFICDEKFLESTRYQWMTSAEIHPEILEYRDFIFLRETGSGIF